MEQSETGHRRVITRRTCEMKESNKTKEYKIAARTK